MTNNNNGKKEQIRNMFNNIAYRYDFLNFFFSIGIDTSWRKKVVSILETVNPETLLDVATGTGDLAIAGSELNVRHIHGVDISEGMLEIGRRKLEKAGLENVITLEVGDSENLHFESNSFDAVTVAFGVRNFENLEKSLKEMYRVLKPGGKLIVLEFSQPEHFPIRQLYGVYFKHILPGIGRVVSKDKNAYSYLPESVGKFPYGKKFTSILDSCQFKNTNDERLSCGIASIYTGEK